MRRPLSDVCQIKSRLLQFIVVNNLQQETFPKTEFYIKDIQTSDIEPDRIRIVVGVNYYQSGSKTYRIEAVSMDGTKRSVQTQFTISSGENYEQLLVIDVRDFPQESTVKLILYNIQQIGEPVRTLILQR